MCADFSCCCLEFLDDPDDGKGVTFAAFFLQELGVTCASKTPPLLCGLELFVSVKVAI